MYVCTYLPTFKERKKKKKKSPERIDPVRNLHPDRRAAGPATAPYLVEAGLGGELRDGGADLPEHLLRAEVVALGVVHLDLQTLRADLMGGGRWQVADRCPTSRSAPFRRGNTCSPFTKKWSFALSARHQDQKQMHIKLSPEIHQDRCSSVAAWDKSNHCHPSGKLLSKPSRAQQGWRHNLACV